MGKRRGKTMIIKWVRSVCQRCGESKTERMRIFSTRHCGTGACEKDCGGEMKIMEYEYRDE